MKYNLSDLYVIKVNENYKYYYLICKKSINNYYIEIFTKRKILVSDESMVEPLGNYYSLFEKYNFQTGKSLKVGLKELITKYVNINRIYNKYGEKNYQMKKYYDAEELVVANLERISNDYTEWGPMVYSTEQKYLFEVIYEGNETKYREVFTGFIASDKEEYFDLPYVSEPKPITDYLPNAKGVKLPKYSLLWLLNDINFKNGNNLVDDDVKDLVKTK